MPAGATRAPEVTNISKHGFCLFIDDRELFLAFADFPWFENASVRAITTIERPLPHHLYWPKLDVDLHLKSIERPGEFPLVARGEV